LLVEINLLLWNCEGLANVCDRMGSIFEKYDVVILTETFLRKEQCIPGFYSKHCFATHTGRPGRPKRGISIYYNAKLGYLKSHFILENFVILNFQNLTIVGSYLHPKMKPLDVTNELVSTIEHIYNFQSLVFAGDFNCKLNIKRKEKIDALMKFASVNDLKLANSLPFQSTYVGHNGSSVVDLILLGSKIKQLDFKVQNSNFRKHNMVNSKFCVKNLRQ
jgi:Endonuclease-reverse transcriptase